jgi:fatty-acyl-CoA synthase/long-chain acyl-CoA synthetase
MHFAHGVPQDHGAGATCPALLVEAAAAHPGADAVVLPDEGLTYRGLADGAAEWARILVSLGVMQGDHVGMLLPNGTQYMQVLFGVMLAGAVAIPFNVRYRGLELATTLADSDVVTIITTNGADLPPLIERLLEAFPDLPSMRIAERLRIPQAPRLRNIVIAEGPASPGFLHRHGVAPLTDAVASAELETRRQSARAEDTALILYTSGSTSRPKGCLLSHAAIVRQGRLLASRYHMTARDRIWSPLPMFHVGGISPMMAIASVGGTFLSMRKPEAGPSLAFMARERVTIAFVPFQTLIADLLQHPDIASYDLSAIRLIVSNPVLLPPWIREQLGALLPQAVQIGTYGMTETVASACTHSPDDERDDRETRLGRPLTGVEVRVIGEDGRNVAPGDIGEVLLRGPTLCKGYYNDPQKTASALQDGWLHTGDRGSLDARG